MKTIIISDIKSNENSIITFGLHLAKQLETEAEVVHPIDSRIHQGEYGAVSDSQSVTPGNTFTHKEIIFREKERVKKDLDKLLISEVSRLNYPLKVHVTVENKSVDEAIKNSMDKCSECIFVASAEPDENIFLSKNEILDTVKSNQAICLLVPPGKSFTSIRKIFVPVDFDSADTNTFAKLYPFIQKIKPYIIAIDVAGNGNYAEKELKSETWKKLAKEFLPASKISTSTLKGKNFRETIANYCNRNNPDLMLISQKKQNSLKQMFGKNKLEKLLNKISVPVLLHYY